MKRIDVIGVQLDLGASKRGVAMGPLAIRYGGIIEGLRACGYEVCDKGDIIPIMHGETCDSMRYYEQIVDANARLYAAVEETLQSGAVSVILGGDHSIAAGSAEATLKHYEACGGVGIIWVDAHGDWNNQETSNSGNMHGMSFSALCGFGPDIMVNYGQTPAYADVSKCVLIGARDLDLREKARMKEAGITVFSMYDIDEMGMGAVIRKAIEIAANGTAGIHVSFDVDSIAPTEAPGTGTPVDYGITMREAHLLMELIAESGKLLSLDMVEVNPILDVRNQTAKLASELVQSAFGKIVF